ncbi:hypothetical protein MXB_905 [Myxobolus squamalis]
MKFIN